MATVSELLFSCRHRYCRRYCRRRQVATSDAADLAWSPDDRAICVWDSVLQYKVCMYQPDGRCLKEYTAYSNALGVKTVRWSPSSQILGIGSYDETARLLNNLTWGEISKHPHPAEVNDKRVVLYREVESQELTDKIEAFPSTGGLHASCSKYAIQDLPYSIDSLKPDPEKCVNFVWLGSVQTSSSPPPPPPAHTHSHTLAR